MEINLGNVVGLIKSVGQPTKTEIIWAKVLNPDFPNIVELRYYDGGAAAWKPLMKRSCIVMTTTGSDNEYLATNTIPVTILENDVLYLVNFHETNTDGVTLKIDALTAKTINKTEGGSLVDIAPGELKANEFRILLFDQDSDVFRIIGSASNIAANESMFQATITSNTFTADKKILVDFIDDENPNISFLCENVKHRDWYLTFSSNVNQSYDLLGFQDFVSGGNYRVFITKGFSEDLIFWIDPSISSDVFIRDMDNQGATLESIGLSGATGSRFELNIVVRQGSGIVEYLLSTAKVVTSVAGKSGAVTLVKADVGLGNVDNTSDANKPVSTAQAAADAVVLAAANSYSDGLVVGLWDDRGGYTVNASGNINYPSSGGSGSGGALKKGDIFTVANATVGVSTVNGNPVNNGDTIRALVDSPSATNDAHWNITENNIGYVPAQDSAVVHNTGDETVGGVKTFSSSPIVPSATADNEAANVALVKQIAKKQALKFG